MNNDNGLAWGQIGASTDASRLDHFDNLRSPNSVAAGKGAQQQREADGRYGTFHPLIVSANLAADQHSSANLQKCALTVHILFAHALNVNVENARSIYPWRCQFAPGCSCGVKDRRQVAYATHNPSRRQDSDLPLTVKIEKDV